MTHQPSWCFLININLKECQVAVLVSVSNFITRNDVIHKIKGLDSIHRKFSVKTKSEIHVCFNLAAWDTIGFKILIATNRTKTYLR